MKTRYLVALFASFCFIAIAPIKVQAVTQALLDESEPPLPESVEEVGNQSQTGNGGDNSQIQVPDTAKKSFGVAKKSILDPILGDNLVNTTSSQAQQQAGTVSRQVQNLLSTQGASGGIGQQVRVFAQEQNRIQERIRVNLQDIQQRSPLMNLLIGPNYQVTEDLKNQLQNTKEQMKELDTFEEDFPLADQSTVASLQLALQAQQDALKKAIAAQEDAFSLFGWAVRGFARIFSE